MFRAVLFDLDDTLYDRGAAFEAWAEWLARAQLGRPLGEDELVALRALDRRGHRSRVEFAAGAMQLGLTVSAEAFPFQLADHLAPEPLVRETLEALAQNRRIAIVTNGGPAQRVKLARLGLDGVVHAVFVSHEVGIAKPDPAIFDRALAWTEQPAEAVLFVGDEPTIDLAPAAAMGMATAWRARAEWPETLAPPTYQLSRIAELPEVCACQ